MRDEVGEVWGSFQKWNRERTWYLGLEWEDKKSKKAINQGIHHTPENFHTYQETNTTGGRQTSK